MLLDRQMKLLCIAELAPETLIVFMGGNVAHNTHQKQLIMTRNSVNTNILYQMYIRMFIVFQSKHNNVVYEGNSLQTVAVVYTESLYPADVICQHWNNCEHKDIHHFEFYFIHWRTTGAFKVEALSKK